jgi:multidrug efflux pump subunit AcrA (membrane-fusion protein)
MRRRAQLSLWLSAAGVALAAAAPARWVTQAPAPELVRADEKQLGAAGVKVERASAAELERVLEVAASVVAPDALTWSVNPRLPGVVRDVRVALGDVVAANSVLCVVESFELGEAVHDYLRLLALVEAHERALPRRREMLERGVEFAAQALERGRELGDRGLNTWRELNELETALRDREFARDNALFEFETRLEDQRIELEAAAEHLKLLGVDTETLANHDSTGAPQAHALDAHSGRYEVRASVGGLVLELGARVGEFVDEHAVLARLRDPATAWVVAHVNERDLAGVRRDAPARIELAAFAGVAITGRVAFVGFELDPRTRAAPVRIEAPNEPLAAWGERWPLRPGMSGRVQLEIARSRAALTLPLSAIWRRGENDHVFVRAADGSFALRAVTLGERSRERVAVLGGVEASDDVAVEGLFFLKSMLGRGDE